MFEIYYNPDFLLVHLTKTYTPNVEKIMLYSKRFTARSFTLEDVFVEF